MDASVNRRQILKNSLVLSAAGLVSATAALGQSQTVCTGDITRAQPKGPFYPVVTYPDLDADLTLVKGNQQRARGEIVELDVLVQDTNCNPIRNALVDLWQACATGKYDHPSDPNTAELDPYFQYAAKVLTDKDGIARLRTIKPGPYPAAEGWIRPPHIHFRISAAGFRPLITQMYFGGEALNPQDHYIKDLNELEKSQLIIDFTRENETSVPKGTFTVVLAS